MSGQLAGKNFGFVNILTTDSQVRKTLQSDFFCMARPCDNGNIIFGNTIYFVKIVGNNQVFIRDDTFNSCDDELVLYFGFQLFEVAFQIRRRSHKYQGIRFLDYLVYIRRKVNALDIKTHTSQISRIMAETFKLFNSVVTTHIPVD